MRIDRIGEFALIKRITGRIHTDASVIQGPGDDCAVLKLNRRHYQLLTCDTIVEGVDFKHSENPYLIGRKALAVSLSDIAACAGIPRHALVSLGLPKNTRLNKVDEILRGVLQLAKRFAVNIAGGDISLARQLTLTVTVSGIVEKKKLVLRNGAKPGDVIFITGSLGDSISGKHLSFTPRIKEARFLVKNFKLNSMVDISDGLTQDLGHILAESNVGAVIYAALVPRYKKSISVKDALASGEEFELLFTLPIKEARRLIAKKCNTFRPIGNITEKKWGLRLVDKNCQEITIQPKGFRHF